MRMVCDASDVDIVPTSFFARLILVLQALSGDEDFRELASQLECASDLRVAAVREKHLPSASINYLSSCPFEVLVRRILHSSWFDRPPIPMHEESYGHCYARNSVYALCGQQLS